MSLKDMFFAAAGVAAPSDSNIASSRTILLGMAACPLKNCRLWQDRTVSDCVDTCFPSPKAGTCRRRVSRQGRSLMDVTVREMRLEETDLIIDYFHRSTPEHLEMMGVDPSRLPVREA